MYGEPPSVRFADSSRQREHLFVGKFSSSNPLDSSRQREPLLIL